MAVDATNNQRILESWRKNAAAWAVAVRAGGVPNRREVTNDAIVRTVLEGQPRTVLDVGCGEGWLARELASHGVEVCGIDATEDLIKSAIGHSQDDTSTLTHFRCLSYEDVANGLLVDAPGRPYDATVCNFSLFGQASVGRLLLGLARLLHPAGRLIIQTPHPIVACGDQPYLDGWREGSWAGFDESFVEPAPWYFRTVESWVELLQSSGLRLIETREPSHPETGKPASILFVASPAR